MRFYFLHFFRLLLSSRNFDWQVDSCDLCTVFAVLEFFFSCVSRPFRNLRSGYIAARCKLLRSADSAPRWVAVRSLRFCTRGTGSVLKMMSLRIENRSYLKKVFNRRSILENKDAFHGVVSVSFERAFHRRKELG